MRYLLVILLLFPALLADAQGPTYNMANLSVNDCYGTLLDSDAGTPAGNYGHNENLVFKICPPGASSVTLTFGSFCTEAVLDVINIFDGPDTTYPLLLSHSGNTSPGTVTANSGCMTIQFKSDGNVACSGWSADWTINLAPPIPPEFLPVSINCFSNSTQLVLDQYIQCDSVYSAAFTLSGPSGSQIASAVPVGCVGDSTNTIDLTFAPAIDKNGSYSINFTYRFKDICDSIWIFNIPATFSVSDCPIEATIISNADTICFGDCLILTAEATGGDSTTYTYSWSNGIPSLKGPHNVCPGTTTTYSVIVDDAGPSPADTAFKTIVVIPPPDAGADFSICQQAASVNLAGLPGGGIWQGSGITDSVTGVFNPKTAGPGTKTIVYGFGNCQDTVLITVLANNAGPNEAACPGAAPFQVTGFSPGGGVWSGPNITSGGIFTPSGSGSYVVTYTTNGCSDTKTINVDSLSLQPADTVCVNQGDYYLSFSPSGGSWAGTGITHAKQGRFSPALAGLGTHALTYTINGCSASVNLTVQGVSAGNNLSSCPVQAPFTLPAASPSGGFWYGNGIIDSFSGLFDPGANNGSNFTATLIYNYTGCTDTITMSVRQTAIGADSLTFCILDPEFLLDWTNVQKTPWNGQWTGTGVTDPDFPGKFDPGIAGPGVHLLTYSANTCSDSLIVVVHPEATGADTTVCETSPPFDLSASPSGGTWSGAGITDSINGVFDPSVTGTGVFPTIYNSYPGCGDTVLVTVDPLPVIQVQGLQSSYCYKDTAIIISAMPAGGNFWGPGISGNTFNPKAAGTGLHYIGYVAGTGDCAVMDSMPVVVTNPMAVTVTPSFDTICYGDQASFSAAASGGNGSYTFNWNNGLGTGQTKTVKPAASTIYLVTASDGCSEPATDTAFIFVHPKISPQITVGPKVCYGSESWAKVNAPAGRTYTYSWNTGPVSTMDSIFTKPATYSLSITDPTSGCKIDTPVTIQGYNYVQAYFTPSPNVACISSLDPDLYFLNLSAGATSGWWSFGDGDTAAFSAVDNPSHRFPSHGIFTVGLWVQNNGGCSDYYEREICIEPASVLHAPTAFTPNNDGKNDFFRTKGLNIKTFHLMVFNRWGEKLFETMDIEEGWDGEYQGQVVQNDVYTYIIYYTTMDSDKERVKKGVVAVVK